jgi:hypothetical protein
MTRKEDKRKQMKQGKGRVRREWKTSSHLKCKALLMRPLSARGGNLCWCDLNVHMFLYVWRVKRSQSSLVGILFWRLFVWLNERLSHLGSLVPWQAFLWQRDGDRCSIPIDRPSNVKKEKCISCCALVAKCSFEGKVCEIPLLVKFISARS